MHFDQLITRFYAAGTEERGRANTIPTSEVQTTDRGTTLIGAFRKRTLLTCSCPVDRQCRPCVARACASRSVATTATAPSRAYTLSLATNLGFQAVLRRRLCCAGSVGAHSHNRNQPQPASLVNGPSYRGYQGASPPAPALSVVPAAMVCAVCADLPLGDLLSLSIGTEAVDDVVDLLLFE